ncbi:related to Acid phosphatase [Cephalotrichum gorgonifer]|uniref:Related to Acid phosphatase n=1 Tax=Cephalotrichum gorgonifer TaxID=2041049 RepID=A0AAE8MSV6_9PEZI|nr:related to Acid phosphatase [Cephalotrichum gorgonifer]
MARSTIILVLSFALTAVAPPFTKGPRANEPASDVPGASFNRIFQIWMENVDFEVAAADENMKWLAENGILLTNFYAGKPSSHPNYVGAVGGDTFGLQNDNVNNIPANVSTVVDLLDYKGISWAEYMEGIPSAGYQGSRSGNYVRKHNPLITYDSVSKNSTRLERIKSLADFDHDLSNNMLPQWAFFAPDIKNDGHDTGIGYGARWLRGWLEPLLKNDHFMNGTLVIVTFDEDGSYDKINRVYTVLLGGAIDPALRGTTDSMYFNHYSAISSVSANWDLPSLGRWDCNANIFSSVANRTNYRNTNISSYEGLWWNEANSPAMATWGQMSAGDIAGLVDVANGIHPDLPESDYVFAERLKLFPEGCKILKQGDEVCGYAISHPICYHHPPALDSLLGEIAPDADQYYIHDIAILPRFRRRGLAGKCISTLLTVARRYPTTCLVSVYETVPFWARFGFVAEPVDEVLLEKLREYGEDAKYLTRSNDLDL